MEDKQENKVESAEKKHLSSKQKKWLFLIGSIILCFVVPILILMYQFEFFKEDTSWTSRFTMLGLCVILVLVVRFYKWINDFIKTFKKLWMRQLFVALRGIVIMVALIIVLETMKESVSDLQIMIGVCGGSFVVGNFLFEMYHEEVKKEEKKDVHDDMVNSVMEALNKERESLK